MTSTAPTCSTARSGLVFGTSTKASGDFKSKFGYQLMRAICAGSHGDGGAAGKCFLTGRPTA